MRRDNFVYASFIFLFFTSTVQAYIPFLSPQGKSVRWSNPRQNIPEFYTNPKNTSGLSEGQIQSELIRALSRWKAATENQFSFNFFQGTDPKTYPTVSANDKKSAIYFASNSTDSSWISTDVIGVTQVWYDLNSGEISNSDIVLNDKTYTFTLNPKDTSSNGTKKVYLGNTITHELGHSIGLSHSGVLKSSMLYVENKDQAHLSCDDIVGSSSLYTNQENRGSIQGKVLSPQGNPVFGAHVLAISLNRGNILAAGITNPDGTFKIQSLEPGAYSILVEPYFAGNSSLPSYFSSLNTKICSGSQFSRTPYLVSNDGLLGKIIVNKGESTTINDFKVICNSSPYAAVNELRNATVFSTAPLIDFNASSDSDSKALVDSFIGNNKKYYKVRNVNGDLSVNTISYSAYSPLESRLRLLDRSGNEINNVEYSSSENQVSESGFTFFDSNLIAKNLPINDYVIEVTTSTIDSKYYPAGYLALDATPFLILTISKNAPKTIQSLTNNPTCRQNEDFQPYETTVRGPASTGSALEEANKVKLPFLGSGKNAQGPFGFCGSVRVSNSANSKSPFDVNFLISWILPWLLMSAMPSFIKKRNHLSIFSVSI
jgi:predicted Zn-dependent protease